MKKKLTKIFDKLILSLLACIGLFSCTDKAKETGCDCGSYRKGSLVPEYGAPAAYCSFEIKAKVTDNSSKPIKNIRIVNQYKPYYADTLYTDNNGNATFQFNDGGNGHYVLQVEDIDGIANGGEFESKDVTVIFTSANKIEEGNGGAYNGKYSKTENIKLSQKN